MTRSSVSLFIVAAFFTADFAFACGPYPWNTMGPCCCAAYKPSGVNISRNGDVDQPRVSEVSVARSRIPQEENFLSCKTPLAVVPRSCPEVQLESDAQFLYRFQLGKADRIDKTSAEAFAVPGAEQILFRFSSEHAVGANPTNVTISDFNNDGHPDMVVANHDVGSMTVLLNDGQAGFTSSFTSRNQGFGGYKPQAADVNDDGLNDIVMPHRFEDKVQVFFNLGKGRFSSRQILNTEKEPQSIVIRDFDEDGDRDLAILTNSSISRFLEIYSNDGAGNFALTFQLDISGISTRISEFPVVHDFDEDGDPDIALNDNSRRLSILLNNGDGSFISHDTGAFEQGHPSGLDFDGDGDLDIAISGVDRRQIVILENLGGLNFRQRPTYLTKEMPFYIVAEDVNQDNLVDLIVSSTVDNMLTVHFNRGDGSFELAAFHINVDRASRFEAGDLDGDGILDLALVNGSPQGSDNVASVYLGSSGSGNSDSKDKFSIGMKEGPIDAVAVGQLAVFPNPSEGRLTVAFEHNNGGMLEFRIADMRGTEVFRTAFEASKDAQGVQTLRLDALPAGMYIIALTTPDGLVIARQMISLLGS